MVTLTRGQRCSAEFLHYSATFVHHRFTDKKAHYGSGTAADRRYCNSPVPTTDHLFLLERPLYMRAPSLLGKHSCLAHTNRRGSRCAFTTGVAPKGSQQCKRLIRTNQPGSIRQLRLQTAAAAQPASSASTSIPEEDQGMDADELKAILLDSFYGTERGFSVSSEARAEISELITQLEAKTPNPAATEAIDKLSGDWKLLYTVNSELTGLLGLSRLPGVQVGEISQSIDPYTLSIRNTVTIGGPVSRSAFSAKAAFEILSPKRIQVKFERAVFETPQLLTDKEFPSSISLLGTSVDLTDLKDSLQPVNASVRSTAQSISRFLQNKPNLDIAIPGNRGAESWLLTTYLDDDLRVSRGDKGAIFVLAKDIAMA